MRDDARAARRHVRAKQLARLGVAHGFGTRHGGEAPVVPGEAPHVVYQAKQVHGATVLRLDGADEPSATRASEADALVTSVPGRAVAVRTADCIPLLLYEPNRGVVAAVHAGWRGIVGGVISATLACLRDELCCRLDQVIAAIGPGIGPCHFEVGEEVASRFERFEGVVTRLASARPHVDLARAVELSLRAHAVQQIELIGTCTYCAPELFHSFRRDGASSTGRQLSFIGVPEHSNVPPRCDEWPSGEAEPR